MSDAAKVGITGLGGVFFRAKDPAALSRWYAEKLDLSVEKWGGVVFRRENEREGATTAWSPFKEGSDYFGRPEQTFMLNYRVLDLDHALAELERRGVEIVPKRDEGEHGRFAWIVDCEGNRVELWEPPAGR